MVEVSSWPIAKLFCNAKLGRYRATADIDQARAFACVVSLATSEIIPAYKNQ
jgi:hypothetical protein